METKCEYTADELRAKDLATVCTACGAAIGEECVAGTYSTLDRSLGLSVVVDPPTRCFARRLRWLLEERRPDLLEPKS